MFQRFQSVCVDCSRMFGVVAMLVHASTESAAIDLYVEAINERRCCAERTLAF